MGRRIRRTAVGIALGLATMAWGAGAAQAFDVTASGGPANPAAGAHSDLNLTLNFGDSTQDVKHLALHLPPGLLGNATAVPACSVAQFSSDAGCDAASQIGSVSSTAVALGIPLQVPGKVYSLQPQGGEPARLGIRLRASDNALLSALGFLVTIPPIDLQAPISLRAPGDYGLDTTIDGIPRSITGKILNSIPLPLNIYLKSMSMTLFGTPPGAKTAFLTNPTQCVASTIKVDASSWSTPAATASGSTSFTPTGCDQVPFDPTLAVGPAQQVADQPTEFTATLGMPAGDTNGRAQSHVKNATIVLPVGTALSPGVGANGVDDCTDAAFAIDSAGAPACPAASQIGTVVFDTPLLGQLSGTAYLGSPTSDAPLRLLVFAVKGDVSVKLAGRVLTDPKTGQITTVFNGLPQVPFTSFSLTFRGGPNAVVKAPRDCGTHTASATLEPYARPGTTAAPTATFATVSCPAPRFAPTLSAGVDPTQAAADTHMVMTISRTDADDLLDGLSVSLPSGLLGHLPDIPACALDAARNGNCPDASRVGTVTAAAGTGSAPASLTGPMYLTGPIDGSIAGMAIVVPAKVGPIDLGKVVVLAKLTVRPDVGIDVSSSGLPRIVGGVPLAIRSMRMAFDRDGFLFNASDCAVQRVQARFTGAGGEVSDTSALYQPSGCGNVPFAPKVSAKIGGTVTAPSLTATIAGVPGQSTLAAAQLTLPVQLGADLNALSKVCELAVYNQGGCPAKSRVGTATALSPLVPVPLTGPVTLLRVPGKVLPSLAVDLSGLLNLHVQIDNDSAGGRIRSTVAGLPDVPLTAFTLDLASGGLLKSDRATLCKGTPKLDVFMIGHNRATYKTSATATNGLCAAAASTTFRTSASLTGTGKGRTPSLRIKVRGSGMKSLRVTLPKQLRLVSSKLRRGGRGLQGGRYLSTRKTLPHTRSTVTVRTTKRYTNTLELRLAKGALTRGSGLKTGRRITLKLRVADRNGKARTITIRVTPRR